MGPPPIGGYVGRLLRLCINGLFAYRYFVELRRKMRPEIARWFVTINPEKKDDGAAISVDLAFVTLPAFCKISSYTFYISSLTVLPETRDFTAMTALLCWSGLYSNVFSFEIVFLILSRQCRCHSSLLNGPCEEGLFMSLLQLLPMDRAVLMTLTFAVIELYLAGRRFQVSGPFISQVSTVDFLQSAERYHNEFFRICLTLVWKSACAWRICECVT